MTPIFFANQLEFRKWLTKNHKKETELLVGYYKVSTGKPSMTWSQSVDQALCFGWIDGVRKSIDSESYCIRFTPRKPKSNWSVVNIKKVEVLIKEGLMQPEGLELFNNRRIEKTYSFENPEKILSPHLEKKFKENKNAWKFFNSQAPSYKKATLHWIMSAKKEETQESRLDKLISESEKQKRIADQYNKDRNI